MKITMDELQAMLANVEIEDEEIAAYLVGKPNEAAPFAPKIMPNRDMVTVSTAMDEMRVEAAFASSALSRIDRWRRRQRFNNGLASGIFRDKPILYAEGDSWFQFPFLLQDIVNNLSNHHLIWCTSEAGDTLQNMVYDKPEYLNELHDLLERRKLDVRFFLLSGAGNDVVGLGADGTPALQHIVRQYDRTRTPEWHIETPALLDVLNTIEKAYLKVLTEVDRNFPQSRFPNLKVVIHGYDYSPPRSVSGPDPKRPRYARDWTGEPLRKKGFPDNAEALKVITALIDRLNAMTRGLCKSYGPRAIHADLRGSVPAGQWADELHPTSAGYRAATSRLRSYLI